MSSVPECPVCGGDAPPLDVVDFNKSCEEARGRFLPLSGTPVYYCLCDRCGFCFAPAFRAWTLEEFSARIYNDEYVQVDPDYESARPRANAENLIALFAGVHQRIRHLDYGGGNGQLSGLLREAGWTSRSYDPFVDGAVEIGGLGRFDLITAYEVFEHVPDVDRLIAELDGLLAQDGVVLLSTLLSDGNIRRHQRLQWWYASPRNGHVSLFSARSLGLLAGKRGFSVRSLSPVFHMLYRRRVPDWAARLISG